MAQGLMWLELIVCFLNGKTVWTVIRLRVELAFSEIF